MANTQQKTPLTQALQAQELGSQSETLTKTDDLARLREAFGRVGDGNSAPDFDQMREALGQFGDSGLSDNLFRDVLAKNGQQELGVQEAPAEQRAEMHARYQELTKEQEQVVVMDSRTLAEGKQVEQIQQEINQMRVAKKIPKYQGPKIVDMRVVDPGERYHLFGGLFYKAKKKIKEYTEPQQIIAKRSAKRTGLVSTAAQDETEQMKLHHEFNVNGGA